MKKLALIVSSVVVLYLSACRTGVPTLPPPVTDTVVDCAKDATRETAKDILTEVEGALVTDSWKNTLIDLAVKFGEEALACVIDHIVNQSRMDTRASADANARKKTERGEEWLHERRMTTKGL